MGRCSVAEEIPWHAGEGAHGRAGVECHPAHSQRHGVRRPGDAAQQARSLKALHCPVCPCFWACESPVGRVTAPVSEVPFLLPRRSPYVYGIHVDEISNEGQGNPDTIEVISKTTGTSVHTFDVLRVWTAAWPAVVP